MGVICMGVIRMGVIRMGVICMGVIPWRPARMGAPPRPHGRHRMGVTAWASFHGAPWRPVAPHGAHP